MKMYKYTVWKRIRDWMRWTTPFYQIREAYWYVIHRFRQDHMIDTKLPKGRYYDVDSLMLHGIFELVDSYVRRDCEDAFSIVDFEWSEEHAQVKQDIIKILHWKNIGRPEIEHQIDSLMHELYGNNTYNWIPVESSQYSELKIIEAPVQYREFKTKKLHKLEAKKEQIDTDMLKRAVEIRNYLCGTLIGH